MPAHRDNRPRRRAGAIALTLLTALLLLTTGPAGAGAQQPAPDQAAQAVSQQPCILIFPPPPGCEPVPPGRITVNAGGPYGGRVGQPVIMRATVSSPLPPGTPFQFQWSFGDGSSGFGQSTSHVYTSPGTYSVTVTVFGGGQTASSSTSASITQPSGPLQVSAGGPYSGRTNTPIQFNSLVSGITPGASVSYQWSFGNGTFGGGTSPTTVYGTPGTYQVTLQVRTSAGQSGFASTTVQVTPQVSPLQVSPGGPYTGTAGSSVTFFGSVVGAALPSYQWSFGDGAVASGQNVGHIYINPGTYSVTLTVTDLSNGQSAQATTVASITAAPSPPTPTPPPAPPAPPARYGAAMAYYPPSGRVVLFGGTVCLGNTCTDQDDTWTWDGSNWTQQAPGNSPPSRYGGSIAYHAPSQRLVLFGGVDCNGDTCQDRADTWTWDGSNWTEQSPNASPPERSDAGIAFDSTRNVLVLFGGVDTGGSLLDDTWIWNGSTWIQQTPDLRPSARSGMGLAFDAARNVVVLFGGSNDSPNGLADTWTWNGSTWRPEELMTAPTPRALPAMVFDAARNVVLLFGGYSDGNQDLGDTWTWNGSTWAQQNPSASPSPRYGAAIAFNGATNNVVLFSGTNGDADTWVWNGSAWQQQ